MSPRAVWRLEASGFGPVYDYAAGKADWLAADLRPRVWRSPVCTAWHKAAIVAAYVRSWPPSRGASRGQQPAEFGDFAILRGIKARAEAGQLSLR